MLMRRWLTGGEEVYQVVNSPNLAGRSCGCGYTKGWYRGWKRRSRGCGLDFGQRGVWLAAADLALPY